MLCRSLARIKCSFRWESILQDLLKIEMKKTMK
ncbi:MAG: hypothetical protein ACI9HG_001588, partial [Flavobacteriales bacterium]